MATVICPLCKQECAVVGSNKVYSAVKTHFRQHVKSSKYGFCSNINCDVVYVGMESDEIYFKRDFDDEIK